MDIRLILVIFGVQLLKLNMEKYPVKLVVILAGTLMVEKNIKLTNSNLLRVIILKVIKLMGLVIFGAPLLTLNTEKFLENQMAINVGTLMEDMSTELKTLKLYLETLQLYNHTTFLKVYKTMARDLFGVQLQLQNKERFLEKLTQLLVGTHTVVKSIGQVTFITYIEKNLNL